MRIRMMVAILFPVTAIAGGYSYNDPYGELHRRIDALNASLTAHGGIPAEEARSLVDSCVQQIRADDEAREEGIPPGLPADFLCSSR